MNKVVGYLEGSDSSWLTKLVVHGYGTLPVSNGYDGHGKNIKMFNANDRVDLMIGYLHKIVPPADYEFTVRDLLHSCLTFNIPVLLAVSEEYQDRAAGLLGDARDKIRLVDPAKMVDESLKVLTG